MFAYYTESNDDNVIMSSIPLFYHSQTLDIYKATDQRREHVLSVLKQ